MSELLTDLLVHVTVTDNLEDDVDNVVGVVKVFIGDELIDSVLVSTVLCCCCHGLQKLL